MTDESKDRIGGKVDELAGRGKSEFGEMTGDDQKRREGEADQARGKAKQGIADLKDKADDLVKNVTDSNS